MQDLCILGLPLHGETIESVCDWSSLQGDGTDGKDLWDALDLILDVEEAFHLSLDGEGSRVVGDEVVVRAVHVVLPQEIVESEVEQMLVNVPLEV